MLKNREMLGSELKEKIEMYSELTGQDGWNVPVTKVADFISGFEMGKERFRKRGHWIDEQDLGYHVSICSNCNWRGHGDTHLIFKTNYCPNCGADMREGEV